MEGTDDNLQFFYYEHLPEHLQEISRPFAQLVTKLCEKLPDNPQRKQMVEKILEAKDCAVRARLYK